MARKHMIKEEDWEFHRNRNGTEHADKCTDGYCEPKGKKNNRVEIHHILCVHACSDETFPDDTTSDDKDFFYDCMAMTTWNINEGKNNIGLPRKWAYVDDPHDTDHPPGKAGWDWLPCHQVDHDIYLTHIKAWVRKNVWEKCRSASKKKKCELMEGKGLADMFDAGSDEYRGILKERGQESGGTKFCLWYCTECEEKLEGYEERWHIPFSMSPDEEDIRPRIKPPHGKKLARLNLLGVDDDVD